MLAWMHLDASALGCSFQDHLNFERNQNIRFRQHLRVICLLSFSKRISDPHEPLRYTRLFFFSTENEEGSYCWFSPIWANQTQVDELHGTNLESRFFLVTWLTQEKGKFIFLLEHFCLQHKSSPISPYMPGNLT